MATTRIEHAGHLRIRLDDGVQREMAGRILDDQETPSATAT
jgi:hypothetical protein